MAGDLFLDDVREQLTDTEIELNRIRALADGVAGSISSAFRGAMMDGRSFRSLLDDIGKAFINMTLRAAFRPLETMTSGFLENLFSGLNPVVPHAKGGVIGTPTYFPLGAG
ncbi:hypothetical protein DMC47_10120, partial [Nostoc sp. 3335mG]